MANENGGNTITDMLQSKAGLAAIIVALTSLLMIKPSPLNSERPSIAPGGNKSIGATQDVDARLWQDPFQTVNEATKVTTPDRFEIKAYDGKKLTIEMAASNKQNDHSPANVFKELPEGIGGGQITLMAVMMSASPTPEEHEMRLRRRYALVSALARKQYSPVDAEHIGYFRINEQETPGLPRTVPFEWFEKQFRSRTKDNSKRVLSEPPARVLVLWVDDTRFDREPVTKTIQLFDQFKSSIASRVKLKDNIARIVMGPSSSGKLRAMASQAGGLNNEMKDSISDIRFYSSQATTADSEILRGIDDKKNLSEYFANNNIHLVRTIADDEKVIESLVKELKIRHVIDYRKEKADKTIVDDYAQDDHIVLLSDWDTYYGRALPRAFIKSIKTDEERGFLKCGSQDLDENVHCFKYVRGIDGILPGSPSNNVKEPSRQTKPESGTTAEISDQPDGMSQKDYLRRIVGEIRKLDDRIVQHRPCYLPTNRCGVAAIGVLGYDVYDKLMILRALRPYFPNKTFFTTDLSASYWSPPEMPYTHNLIVASGFGLTLDPELQKDIPPFRDSYQTSLFLSVLLALENSKTKSDNSTAKIPGVDKPRIFEIGRNGPIDLSDPNSTQGDIPEKNSTREIAKYNTIHPKSILEQSQEDSNTLITIVLAVCSFVLLYLASWNVRSWVNHIFLKNETEEQSDIPANFFQRIHLKRTGIVLFFLLAALLVWWCTSISALNKEPLLWLEGVSIWPSEFLRFIALIASIGVIHETFRKISETDLKIATTFGFAEKEGKTQPAPSFLTTLIQALSSLSNCTSVHKWQSAKDKPWLNKTAINGLEAKEIEVSKLWKSYLEKGEPKRRVCRTLVGMVPFLVFAWSAIVLSGGMTSPVRGDFAYYADKMISIPVVLLMLFLTVLIIDASRLCAAAISHLGETQSDWLAGTNHQSKMILLSNHWGLKPAYAAYWLDVQFVAQRTDAIQKLIWYPVIPIFLLVASRSPLFDDWSHPAGLIATLSILIVYLISCAFLLERGAKNMREKASRKLSEELRKLRGNLDSANNPEIKQLEYMIREIEELRKGAFLPLFQQPWVEAVLALAGGAGGLAWMGNILGTP